jgi:hypothetical protein
MKHNIIQTENYLLIVDDLEIKVGDWFYDNDGELCKYTSDYVVNPNEWKDNKKIIAHLPLNNSSILEGVDLLPEYSDKDDIWNEGLEDVLNKLPYTKHLDDGQYNDGVIAGFESGAIWGYNKAKKRYKWTDDDVIRIVEKSRETGLTAEFLILSHQQPKYPIGFECEREFVENKLWGQKGTGIYKSRTTTNLQGFTEWVGRYIW